jgi:hypothetical protein
MGRKQLAAAEAAVIRAARDVVAGWDLGATWSWSRRYKDLREAVAALDAVPLPNPEAGHGRWVEGSPETSRNAALVRPKGTRWAIVLQLSLASREQRGLTDEELERRLKAKHTTVSAARNHLVGVGWVQDSGYRRNGSAGRPAVVWELTPAATARVREMAQEAD